MASHSTIAVRLTEACLVTIRVIAHFTHFAQLVVLHLVLSTLFLLRTFLRCLISHPLMYILYTCSQYWWPQPFHSFVFARYGVKSDCASLSDENGESLEGLELALRWPQNGNRARTNCPRVPWATNERLFVPAVVLDVPARFTRCDGCNSLKRVAPQHFICGWL